MIPRDYQDAAVNAVWNYFMEKSGNPIVAMPTGTGKSLVIALLVQSMLRGYPSTRVVMLTHVKELIENNFETLMRIWPSAPAGIYSAGLKRRDTNAQITFAGIASVAKRAKLFSKTDIVLIDECHLVSDSDSAMYVRFLKALKSFNPMLKVIGLSATPFRLGSGELVDGSLFDDVCFDLTSGEAFVWMIEQGYLCPVVPKKPLSEIDTSSVGMRGGEFVPTALRQAIDDQGVLGDAIMEAVRLAEDRDHWLVFTDSIDHCEELAHLLTDLGIPAAPVHSKLSPKQRDLNIADFKAGHLRALVNKDILTTGFDFPQIDCIVMLRPTQSPALWVQMLGRGTRPVFAPGYDITTKEGRLAAIAAGPKQDCLVLDFAANTARLGPINYPMIPKRRGKGSGDPPARACPDCATYVHISIRVCPVCAHEFPPPAEKLQHGASTSELIAKKKPQAEPEIGVFPVTDMIATRHLKAGRPDSVRVQYYCNTRRFVDWVGVEHVGYMRTRALRWWRGHAVSGKDPMPETTNELLDGFAERVRRPSHIKVILNRKYPEIIEYDFTGTGFAPFGHAHPLELDKSAGAGTASAPNSGPSGGVSALPELPDLSDFQ